ncbi:MAG: hypothetical protein PWP45_1954 [Tepidanaerobacteraceae bacterium]|nr:hypothetical protein [Tepidanaerobacteraceae bacterium]
MADIEEIKGFLDKAKRLLKSGSFDFVPRKKNMDSIKSAGLTIKHVKEIILSLNYKNYCRGPVEDLGYNRQGFVWEFDCNIDSVDFYIKLKIEERGEKECLVCLSFHIAEYPLCHPYK